MSGERRISAWNISEELTNFDNKESKKVQKEKEIDKQLSGIYQAFVESNEKVKDKEKTEAFINPKESVWLTETEFKEIMNSFEADPEVKEMQDKGNMKKLTDEESGLIKELKDAVEETELNKIHDAYDDNAERVMNPKEGK